MNLAACLLSSTTLSIQEIASKVGIPDISLFSKMFKARMGVSASVYRKMEPRT